MGFQLKDKTDDNRPWTMDDKRHCELQIYISGAKNPNQVAQILLISWWLSV